MSFTLTEQVEALIDWATQQARSERRKYFVQAVRVRDGRWYYEAGPRDGRVGPVRTRIGDAVR